MQNSSLELSPAVANSVYEKKNIYGKNSFSYGENYGSKISGERKVSSVSAPV